jgi:hypothetical protein
MAGLVLAICFCAVIPGARGAASVAILSAVIVREGGRSSIPEAAVINREAAAYWIPRMRGG